MSQAAYDGLRWAVFVLLLLGVATVVKGMNMITLTKEEDFLLLKEGTVNRLVFSIGNAELQEARRLCPKNTLKYNKWAMKTFFSDWASA